MKQLPLLLLLLSCITCKVYAWQSSSVQKDEKIVDSLSLLINEPFYKPDRYFNEVLKRIETTPGANITTETRAKINLIKATLGLTRGDTAAAIRYTGQATIFVEQVDDMHTANAIKANIAALYLRAGKKSLGVKYLEQSTLGGRNKIVFTNEWLAGVQARNQAYLLLREYSQIQTSYNNALRVAEQAGKQPLYKLNSTFAASFIEAGDTKKAFELLDALVSDTGFTTAQYRQLYNRLIIYSIKAGRHAQLKEYITKLAQLPLSANRALTTESLLAIGMYNEYLKKFDPAIKQYRRLGADYRLHGPSQNNIEGMIRLAALYHKTQAADSASYYFGILKNEFTGGLLQLPVGQLYKQALADYTHNGVSKTLNTDTAYQSKLYAATKELEYQYQVIKQKQDNVLLKQKQQLQSLQHTKKRQQLLVYILILALLLVVIGTITLLLIWRRRQAFKEHSAEKARLEQIHKANLAKALTNAQEEERSQIAETLHSEVGAMLAVARLNLSTADEDEDTPVQISGGQVKLATDILAKLTQTIRDMSHRLMPIGLKQMGLQAAIEDMVREINHAGIVKIETIFININRGTPLPDDMQVNIYRMVQELFQNMLKHAAANRAFLQIVKHPDSLNIIFEDNGRGIKPTNTDGAGLLMMRKRAEYYNGTLTIEQREGGGSVFIIELLLQPNN